MPNVFATRSGLWSNTLVWNTSSLPTVADDVFANNFTVTIDISPQVLSINTTAAAGINAGGSFRINNNISLSADNIIAGGSTCLTFLSATPNACFVYGNAYGSDTTSSAHGVNNNSSGTLFFYGSAFGSNTGNRASHGIVNASTGTINAVGNLRGGFGATPQNNSGGVNSSSGIFNVLGNVIGGPAGTTLTSQCRGIFNNSTGTVNITGNAIGGGATANVGAVNSSTGTINILGNVIGGPTGGNPYGGQNGSGNFNIIGDVIGTGTGIGLLNGSGTASVTGRCIGLLQNGIFNNTTGTVIVNGTCIGEGFAAGIVNNSTGTVYAKRIKANNTGMFFVSAILPAAGATNNQNGILIAEELEFGDQGLSPVTGPVYIAPLTNNVIITRLSAFGPTNTFYTNLSVSNLFPPASSVRQHITYNQGKTVGTMIVPPVSAVQSGVLVDNTAGTAVLTPLDTWNTPLTASLNINSFGDRIKNIASVSNLGNAIALNKV